MKTNTKRNISRRPQIIFSRFKLNNADWNTHINKATGPLEAYNQLSLAILNVLKAPFN